MRQINSRCEDVERDHVELLGESIYLLRDGNENNFVHKHPRIQPTVNMKADTIVCVFCTFLVLETAKQTFSRLAEGECRCVVEQAPLSSWSKKR